MSETARLGLPLIGENDSGKYLTHNEALGDLDKALARKMTVSLASASAALTDADYQENLGFLLTGVATSGRTVTLPSAIERIALFAAAAGNSNSLNVKIGSNTVTLAPGESAWIHTDGAGNLSALLRGVLSVISDFLGLSDTPSSYSGAGKKLLRVNSGATAVEFVAETVDWTFALSDESTAIATGTAKLTWRAPFAFTLTAVRASLNTVSSSGLPTVDINVNGSTILSTKLTIDASEKTSVTAATAAVISSASIADDDELTFDIDVAGTGAKGLKVTLIGTRA